MIDEVLNCAQKMKGELFKQCYTYNSLADDIIIMVNFYKYYCNENDFKH